MRRRLFPILAAASLACCVVSAVGWVRSYFASETWTRVKHEEVGHRVAGLASAEGLVAWFEQRHAYHGETAQHAWRARRHQLEYTEGASFERAAHGTTVGDIVGRSYADHWGLLTFDYVGTSRPRVLKMTSFPWSANVRMSVTAVVVPWWVLVVASAVLPVVRVGEVLRTWRRAKRGLCRACGYDLRASEGRCPECGEVIAG